MKISVFTLLYFYFRKITDLITSRHFPSIGDDSSRLRLRLNYDRRSVGQSLSMSGTPLGPMTRFFVFFSLSENVLIPRWAALSDERTDL
jgi:hypothetical protein